MKKLIALVLSLVTITLATSNVQAKEMYNSGYATTTATYKVDSQFCVLIPETIDLNNGSFEISVAYMDILETEYIDIKLTNTYITLTNENGKSFDGELKKENGTDLDLSESIATFGIGNDNAKGCGFFLSHGGSAGAGTYTGDITFDIQLCTTTE